VRFDPGHNLVRRRGRMPRMPPEINRHQGFRAPEHDQAGVHQGRGRSGRVGGGDGQPGDGLLAGDQPGQSGERRYVVVRIERDILDLATGLQAARPQSTADVLGVGQRAGHTPPTLPADDEISQVTHRASRSLAAGRRSGRTRSRDGRHVGYLPGLVPIFEEAVMSTDYDAEASF
jgi:hypothetical protein